MNFLSLFQRLHSEAGRQGSTPTTVLSQTGMNQRLVNWIVTAYEDVQSEHQSWLFRQEEFTGQLSNGVSNYLATTFSITDFSAWKINYDHDRLSGITIYVSTTDEEYLEYVPWDDFIPNYRFGSSRTQTQRPSVVTIKPDFSLEFWPIPNATYNVAGEYYKSIQTLTTDLNEPIFPDYHMIIVWKALMYYGAFEGAPEVYAHGQEQYNKLLAALEINQLDKITYGSPLA
jgi:hypothetical protein